MGIEGRFIPATNVNSATVPGSAAAWVDIHANFGSGTKTLGELLEVCHPVLCFFRLRTLTRRSSTASYQSCYERVRRWPSSCCRGVQQHCLGPEARLTFANRLQWALSEELLRTASPAGAEVFLLDGKAPRAGQIFTNPGLANTFKAVASKGKAGFYEGPVAQAIVDGK
jgi:gamma-glutamyltranspeptidase/glutathione hydrolase